MRRRLSGDVRRGMQLSVFSAHNTGYQKRQRAHRACDECKRKRRRCSVPVDSERCAFCQQHQRSCSLAPASPLKEAEAETEDEDNHQPRFIGHLNPETVFATTSAAPVLPDEANVGLWAASSPDHDTVQPPDARVRPRPRLPSALHAYLCSLSAFATPPRSARQALIDLYLASVHPLLPIIDAEAIVQQHQRAAVSLPLLHAILLVAARHPHARSLLPLPPRRFAQETSRKIVALLHAGLEKDKLTLTRIHALLALHSEGPSGNEAASLSLATAIHAAHSLGLHLRGRIQSERRKESQLWWCLWGLDRLQAAMCGRPVLARFVDVGLDFPRDEEEGVGLTAWCRIAGVLGRVIAMYRPGHQVAIGWEDDFPSFEELVPLPLEDQSSSNATLKLLYHSIAILSHRTLSETSTKSYSRRMQSAHQILELFSVFRPTQELPPIPVIPYAASLALATFYSALRRDRDMYSKYSAVCGILADMETQWWFAGAMARVGRRALETVDRREAVEGLGMLAQDTTPLNHTSNPTVKEQARETDAIPYGDDLEGMDEFLTLFPDLGAPVEWDDFLVGTDFGASEWWIDSLGSTKPNA